MKHACFDHPAKNKSHQSNKKDDNFDLLRRVHLCCTKADPFDKLSSVFEEFGNDQDRSEYYVQQDVVTFYERHE